MEDGVSKMFEDIVACARRDLGSASVEFVQRAHVYSEILDRCAQGTSVGDAVLSVVHGNLRSSRELEGDFAAFVTREMERLSHGLLGNQLRSTTDSNELVQSVLGDLWTSVADLEFTTKKRFLALLRMRVTNKAREKGRRSRALKQGGDQPRERISVSGVSQDEDDAVPEAANEREGVERLMAQIPSMKAEDKEVLRLFLEGRSHADMADALGLTEDAARKRLARAKERLKAGLS